jgi:hypothetical protein
MWQLEGYGPTQLGGATALTPSMWFNNSRNSSSPWRWTFRIFWEDSPAPPLFSTKIIHDLKV